MSQEPTALYEALPELRWRKTRGVLGSVEWEQMTLQQRWARIEHYLTTDNPLAGVNVAVRHLAYEWRDVPTVEEGTP